MPIYRNRLWDVVAGKNRFKKVPGREAISSRFMDKRDYYLYSVVKIGIFIGHFKKIKDLNGLLADMI
jgi:aspartyl/asparaginyl beta-hydroxylase (cupin superfamily)